MAFAFYTANFINGDGKMKKVLLVVSLLLASVVAQASASYVVSSDGHQVKDGFGAPVQSALS